MSMFLLFKLFNGLLSSINGWLFVKVKYKCSFWSELVDSCFIKVDKYGVRLKCLMCCLKVFLLSLFFLIYKLVSLWIVNIFG